MRHFTKVLTAILCASMILTGKVTVSPGSYSAIETQAATKKSKIKLNKKKLILYEGDTYTLKVKGTKAKVKWSSSDKDVAKVSKKGIVTAIKEGSCTVTAKVKNKKYKCQVTVYSDKDDDSSSDSDTDNNTTNSDSDNKTPEPVLSDIQKSKNALLETIRTEGFYNKAGHMAMTYKAGSSTIPVVQYLESEDALEFSFLDITNLVMSTCSFKLPMKQDNPVLTIEAGVTYKSFDLDGICTINASDLYFNDTNSAISFIATQKDGSATASRQQELLNSASNFAFVVWDILVDIYCHSSFNKIGLTRLTTSSIVGSPSELVANDDSTPFGKLWNYVETNGSLQSDGEKVVSVDYNDGHYTTGIINIMAYEDTHTIEIQDCFEFRDGGNRAMGIFTFDIDKDGNSAGIIVDYQDLTRGNSYKAVTRNFDPGTYVNRSTTIYFIITKNTTTFSDYFESNFTSKQIVPNCLEHCEIGLNKIGFSLNELGFKNFVPLAG